MPKQKLESFLIFDDFSSPESDFIKPVGIGSFDYAKSFRKKQTFFNNLASCETRTNKTFS